MTISIRLNDEENMLVRKYAQMNGMSVSELMRQSVLERIYDEHDLKLYQEALEEYLADPVTHTLEEVEKELGLR
ncbi:MAG: type II toxin-antitoxin system RelB family antitoxin [Christensenellales bacterium]